MDSRHRSHLRIAHPADLHGHECLRPGAGLAAGGMFWMRESLVEKLGPKLDYLRFVLYVGYKFNDWIVFNSEIEYEHATTDDGKGEVAVEFAYLDFLLDVLSTVRREVELTIHGLQENAKYWQQCEAKLAALRDDALRAGGFLTRDSRMKERKKYGKRGARRSFQFSKR